MDIIEANEVFWYAYGPPPKGTFNNEEVNNLVGEPYRRVSLKGVAKARLAAVVAVEASAQVRDDIINQKGELNE
jgi:hypothetical protein